MDTQLTPKKQAEILVTTTGEIRAIHSDAIMPVLENLGIVIMRRASHVEPASGIRDVARDWFQAFMLAASPEAVARYKALEGHKRITYHDGLISHIDGREQWYADLTPVNGPVLGPFDSKQLGLDAEVAWLRENGIPLAEEGKGCEGPVCGDLGESVYVVANEHPAGGGGFDWHTTQRAALRDFHRTYATAPIGTFLYYFEFKHGGDINKITTEIGDRLYELENAETTHRVEIKAPAA